MSFFKKEPEYPIPRDWQNLPLTENQIHEIARYFGLVERGSYSYSFLKELQKVASDSFQRAYKIKDHDRMTSVGLELQVIDHVLHVAFDGNRPKKNLQLDPKHQEYLSFLEEKALQAVIDAEEKQAALEQNLLDEEDVVEQQPLFEVEESTPLSIPGLSDDVVAAFYPRSSHPDIAKIQERLERYVLEYRDAVEDGEPPFILKRIERNIAATHEELSEAQNRLGAQRRFRKSRFRYNPWF